MPETIRTSWLARNVLIVEGVKQDLCIVTNNVRIASIGRPIGLIIYLQCSHVEMFVCRQSSSKLLIVLMRSSKMSGLTSSKCWLFNFGVKVLNTFHNVRLDLSWSVNYVRFAPVKSSQSERGKMFFLHLIYQLCSFWFHTDVFVRIWFRKIRTLTL